MSTAASSFKKKKVRGLSVATAVLAFAVVLGACSPTPSGGKAEGAALAQAKKYTYIVQSVKPTTIQSCYSQGAWRNANDNRCKSSLKWVTTYRSTSALFRFEDVTIYTDYNASRTRALAQVSTRYETNCGSGCSASSARSLNLGAIYIDKRSDGSWSARSRL